VNEFPEFLVGEGAENAQHVVIKYLTLEKLKKRGSKSSKKDMNGTGSTLKTSQSSPSLTSSRHQQQQQRRTSNARALSARNSIAVDRLAYSARLPAAENSHASKSSSFGILSSRSLPDKTDKKQVQFGLRNMSPYGSHLTVPGLGLREGEEEDETTPRQRHASGGELNIGSNTSSKTTKSRSAKERHMRTNSLDPRTLKRALEGRQSNEDSSELFNGGGNRTRALPSPLPSVRSDGMDKTLEGESEEEGEGDVTLVVPSITIPPLDLKLGGSDEDEK
jgi:hypothetical protein